jgi:hypothetical protein
MDTAQPSAKNLSKARFQPVHEVGFMYVAHVVGISP